MAYWWRRREQAEILDVLYERNGTFLGVEVESEAVDGGRRDVIVDDAVEAEKSALVEGRTAEVAAFELTFGAFRWKPGSLGGFGGCFGRGCGLGEEG
jgi:hypothetical protein